MSESSTPPSGTNGAAKVIDISGGYDIESFGEPFSSYSKEPLGNRVEEETQDSDEEVAELEADSDDSAETSDDSDDEETSDEGDSADESGEESEDAQPESPSSKTQKYKFKTVDADGKPVTQELDGSTVFLKRVDGKVQEVTLDEALTTVAGERTVQQRLGEIGQVKYQYDQALEKVQAREQKLSENWNQLLKLSEIADQGKPEQVLVALARLRGVSPAAYYRGFVGMVSKWAQALQGKTPEQMEALFAQEDAKHYREQLEYKKRQEEESSSEHSFLQLANRLVQEGGISEEEFVESKNILTREGKLAGRQPEENLRSVIQFAQHRQHVFRLDAAFQRVDPKLRSDRQLVTSVFHATNSKDFSEEDLVDIIKASVSDRISAVSKDLSAKARKNGNVRAATSKPGNEKANKRKPVVKPQDLYNL